MDPVSDSSQNRARPLRAQAALRAVVWAAAVSVNRIGGAAGLALCLTPLMSAQEIPVDVTSTHIDGRGDLQYVLLNTSAKAATAWTVAVKVRAPDGVLTRDTRVTHDQYIRDALQGRRPDTETQPDLLPNKPLAQKLSGPIQGEPEVRVLGIVFADGTSIGDEAAIREILKHRMADADARLQILLELRDAQKSQQGIRALQEAQTRMAALPADDSDAIRRVRKYAAADLARALSDVKVGRIDPAVALAQLILTLEQQHRAAVKHSGARKEGGNWAYDVFLMGPSS